MSSQLISTLGTSLLTNGDCRPWADWSSRTQRPAPSTRGIVMWMSIVDTFESSAETNTQNALDLDEVDTWVFLHSDTPNGHHCAEALVAYYKMRRRAVTLEKIGKLTYAAEGFTTGLESWHR
jgi:hypothetical protein